MQPGQLIIDSHHHVWDLSLKWHSWCSQVPPLNRSFLIDEYSHVAKKDKSKSMVVEADVDEQFIEAETRWMLGLADSNDNPIVGVIGACRPEGDAKSFRAYIEKFVGNSHFKGVRRLLQDKPDSLSQSGTFVENIRSLANYNLPFELGIAATQMPVAIELVKKCPDVQFILDHCGSPDIKAQLFYPWGAQVKQLAAFPNVGCKISGVVTCADFEHWKPQDLRPFVEHAIECFGWNRVMFGSDWPVCTLAASFDRWIETILELTRGASGDELDGLFRSNAERIYRLA
jgi:predicted TIM-barrel fold metal-dependent hydrolase